jgi:hypothetical protein
MIVKQSLFCLLYNLLKSEKTFMKCKYLDFLEVHNKHIKFFELSEVAKFSLFSNESFFFITGCGDYLDVYFFFFAVLCNSKEIKRKKLGRKCKQNY